MKRRVEQLTNGRFDYEIPELVLSQERIEGVTGMQENYRGKFMLSASDGRKLKGTIHPSASRAKCSIYEFADRQIQVVYEIDMSGLFDQEKAVGSFCISTNIGEVLLPYEIQIQVEPVHIGGREIADLEAFKDLAAADFAQAYKLFLHPSFGRLLQGEAQKHRSLWMNFSTLPGTYQDLEEFLVGAGLKEPVKVKTKEVGRTLSDLHASVKETVVLNKNQWGAVRIEVSSDAPFLELEKKVITADDFIGSNYALEYIVREERFHGGRNFGRITFSTYYETFTYDIEIRRKRENQKGVKNRKLRGYVLELMNAYMDFRLKRLALDQWVDQSEPVLQSIAELGEEYRYYQLFRVQLCLAQERSEEAHEILQQFEERPRLLYHPSMRAYYAYLSALYNRNDEYTMEMKAYISEQQMQNRESWQILWTQLYMDDNLRRSPARRLDAIQEQFSQGTRSRIMYLEAYSAMQEDVSKIKQLSSFENQVLLWAVREEILEEEIASQCAKVSLRHKNFDEQTYRLLSACYQLYPGKELLNAVCTLLIKGHKTDYIYFHWYEKAVREELRITRLYEYYVDAMDENYTGILPQMIRKYFAYNNTLSYKKKAFIYANVIRNRELDRGTFQSYYLSMERFAMDQLAAGHINRNLCIIYKEFMDKITYTPRMADTMAQVLFTYEVICHDPRIKKINVVHHPMKGLKSQSVTDGAAYIQIYTPDASIAFVDEHGRRYYDPVDCTLEKVLRKEFTFSGLAKYKASQIGVRLHLCQIKALSCRVNRKNIRYFQELFRSEEITRSFKTEICRGILNYYHSYLEKSQEEEANYHIDVEAMDAFLEEAGFEKWIAADRIRYTEILIMRYYYMDSFRLISQYGSEGISRNLLIKLCSRMILQLDQEEDKELVTLSAHIFRMGKYDEVLLSYLACYYSGALMTMYEIWKASARFDVETFELEERILLTSMYVYGTVPEGAQIFAAYCRKDGKSNIIKAYLTYQAFIYFYADQELDPVIASALEKRYERQVQLDDICYLAVLKYQASLSQEQQRPDLVKKLLKTYAVQDFRFAFYKEFPEEWIRPYHMLDRTFAEFKGDPANRARIHYAIVPKGEKAVINHSELMKGVYPGFYSSEFTLYFNEVLHYYITEETAAGEVLQETEVMTVHPQEKGTRKYEMVNQIIKRHKLYEEAVCEKKIEAYLRQTYLVEKMFPLS